MTGRYPMPPPLRVPMYDAAARERTYAAALSESLASDEPQAEETGFELVRAEDVAAYEAIVAAQQQTEHSSYDARAEVVALHFLERHYGIDTPVNADYPLTQSWVRPEHASNDWQHDGSVVEVEVTPRYHSNVYQATQNDTIKDDYPEASLENVVPWAEQDRSDVEVQKPIKQSSRKKNWYRGPVAGWAIIVGGSAALAGVGVADDIMDAVQNRADAIGEGVGSWAGEQVRERFGIFGGGND